MPPGLIQDEDGMGAGVHFPADLAQVLVHRLGIAPRHDQPRSLALLRADGTEYVGP